MRQIKAPIADLSTTIAMIGTKIRRFRRRRVGVF